MVSEAISGEMTFEKRFEWNEKTSLGSEFQAGGIEPTKALRKEKL